MKVTREALQKKYAEMSIIELKGLLDEGGLTEEAMACLAEELRKRAINPTIPAEESNDASRGTARRSNIAEGPQTARFNTDEMSLLQNLGEMLLASPDRKVTDHERESLLELTTPNLLNAWTHVVPALSKYAKLKGKRNILGHDKGRKAYQNLFAKLYLVVLALYGDRLLLRGARTEDCLLALLRSLVMFKGAFPNWMDAYSAGNLVFVEQRDIMMAILEKHQRAAEVEIDRRKAVKVTPEVWTKEDIIKTFGITDEYFSQKFKGYVFALRISGESSHWNADVDDFAREQKALTEREIAIAQHDFNQAVLNRVKLALTVEEPMLGAKDNLMKITCDQTWRTHMEVAEKIEQFKLGLYRMVFLRVIQQSSFIHYHYRLIVFPPAMNEPVLSLNLESNPIAGTCCLGAHIGDRHENLGFGNKNMPPKDFKIWAIDTAKRYLGLAAESSLTPKARIRLADRENIEDQKTLKKFLSIASLLTIQLASERKKWFAACLESMEKLKQSFDSKETDIKTTLLEGLPNHIIKSFQIVHVLSFINGNRYAGDRIGEFTRLLCANVCKTDWNHCKPYVKRYTELKKKHLGNDFHKQFLKFSEDLALAISRVPMGMFLAASIDTTVIDFYWRNLFHSADAFDDIETATEILEAIRRLHQPQSKEPSIKQGKIV